MATVKRTFTMPEALISRQRDTLIDAIDNFEKWQPKAKSVVETMRELRQEQSQNLAT